MLGTNRLKMIFTLFAALPLIMLFQNCSDRFRFAGDGGFAQGVSTSNDNPPVSTSTSTTTSTPGATATPTSSDSLIECELGSANAKVILEGNSFAVGSNDQTARVCMSENACLSLVNAYAASRNCSLSLGPATTQGEGQQCTQRFPGSNGTCNNATALNDAQVAALLLNMGQ